MMLSLPHLGQLLGIVVAWSIIGMLSTSLIALVRDLAQTVHRQHQIPCADCRFFTGQTVLKCTVHPKEAFSDMAVDCPDFRS